MCSCFSFGSFRCLLSFQDFFPLRGHSQCSKTLVHYKQTNFQTGYYNYKLGTFNNVLNDIKTNRERFSRQIWFLKKTFFLVTLKF